jgi:hypothetical protein
MRSKVPKEVTIEDTIVGPLTGKQFLWLLGGGILLLILYHFFDLSLFIIIAIIVGGLSCAFAFLRPYNQSLIAFLGNVLLYGSKDKQYIWKRGKKQFKPGEKKDKETEIIITKKEFPHQKVKKLANILDTDGRSGTSDEKFFKSALEKEDPLLEEDLLKGDRTNQFEKNIQYKEKDNKEEGAAMRNIERNIQLNYAIKKTGRSKARLEKEAYRRIYNP